MSSPWILCYRRNPAARLRLVCLPYAGGGASIYRTWHEAVPAGVEVLSVQLPGHESRLHEEAISDLAVLVPALADALTPLRSGPFALFGHSMGALLAFQLCRELRRRGEPLPKRLFVSGRPAPACPARHPPIYQLPEPEFLTALVARYNGIPESILRERELLDLVLPVIRADLAMVEGPKPEAEAPLSCPLSALGGIADPIAPEEDVKAWRGETTGPFETAFFPGGHFFLTHADGKPLLLRWISTQLARLIAGADAGGVAVEA